MKVLQSENNQNIQCNSNINQNVRISFFKNSELNPTKSKHNSGMLYWHETLMKENGWCNHLSNFLMTLLVSPRQLGQYHLPLGLLMRLTQLKWNHSMTHASLSQPIISPYDTWSHRQYVGSSGSIGGSMGDVGAWSFSFLVLRFFFFLGTFSFSSCCQK